MHWTWACLRIRHCGAQVGRPRSDVDIAVGEAVVVEGAFEFDVVVVATF